MNYILGLIGITVLCALWMAFQLWLTRVDPQREAFKPGCGACQSRSSCASGSGEGEKTITIAKSNRRKERA